MNLGPPARPRAALTRWLLFVALAAGILSMHVLSGGDGSDHHGGLPVPSSKVAVHSDATGHSGSASTDPVASHDPAAAAAPATTRIGGGMPAQRHVADTCVLFLVAGSVMVLLGLRSADSVPHPSSASARPACHRGPPRWPNLRLTPGIARI